MSLPPRVKRIRQKTSEGREGEQAADREDAEDRIVKEHAGVDVVGRNDLPAADPVGEAESVIIVPTVTTSDETRSQEEIAALTRPIMTPKPTAQSVPTIMLDPPSFSVMSPARRPSTRR